MDSILTFNNLKMKHTLIAILAIFTFMGTQAAEPSRQNSVKNILKKIKNLAGNHIRVEEHNGDSIVNDIKQQLNKQFDEEKVSETFEKYKIKLDKVVYAESQNEEGYNQLSKFAARLQIDQCDKLAGIPLQLSNNEDSAKTYLFSDSRNQLIFTDSLLRKKYSIVYFDDDVIGKSQSILQILINDALEESFNDLSFLGPQNKKDEDIKVSPTDGKDKIKVELKDITKNFDKVADSIYHFKYTPDEEPIIYYMVASDTNHHNISRDLKFKKKNYIYEGESPSIHYYQATAYRGYNQLQSCMHPMLKMKVGDEACNALKCVWVADTLGMHIRQFSGMKNVTLYCIDIPDEQCCAALITNGGLKSFKDFFNSYTIDGVEKIADKCNVVLTPRGMKVQFIHEKFNDKNSGLHLNFQPFEKARTKGLLPYYEYSL